MKTRIFIALLTVILEATFSFAQPGTLDLSFDTGTGANGEVYATAVQNDGKIIVVGGFGTFNDTPGGGIVRLNEDGSVDGTFNPGAGTNNIVYAVAIQDDGRIIIGGDFTSYNGTAINHIARLNMDGTLDSNFLGSGANDRVNTITIQSDGKILIGGYFASYSGTPRSYIARLNDDGTLDSGFDPGVGANNWVYTTALQPDGKVVVGGDFTAFNFTDRNHIVRLNTDGTVDDTFDPGTGASAGVRTVVLQPDGKIIAGGNFTAFNEIVRNYIVRLNDDGVVDETFDPGANSSVYTSTLQPDGKIVIGGAFTMVDETDRDRIARLHVDGALDMAFNSGSAANSWIVTTSLQPDGKIIAGGAFTMYDVNAANRIGRIINTCYSSTGTDMVSTCNSFTWIDGNTYTESNNSATHVITGGAANGCDSLVTLNLTIFSSATATDELTACNAFTWIDGNTYTESNNSATHVIAGGAANGCDSLVTLNLTIFSSATATDEVTACNAVTWIDGNTYTESNNSATHVIAGGAVNGCDSLVTLNLTIFSSATSTDEVTSCNAFTWIDGNTYTESNSSATHIIPGAALGGCDSLITLNLTIFVVDTSVSVSGTTLMANASAATYQWLDCNNGYTEIVQATDQSFTPEVTGIYAVSVTQNECTDTSYCYLVEPEGLKEMDGENDIAIFPNPVTSRVTVMSENTLNNATLCVENGCGQLVVQVNNLNGRTTVLDDLHWPPGLYVLHLIQDGRKSVAKRIVVVD